MKKMLVIGDGDSVFVKDFINQYNKKGVIIDLISLGKNIDNEVVRFQKNITFNFSFSFSIISYTLNFMKIIDEMDDDYDVIVIHFIYFFLGPYIYKLKRKTKRLVSVVWGSDFYRITSKFKKILQMWIFRKSDAIVFTNPKTRSLFIQNIKGITAELYIARFGLPVLDEIEALRDADSSALSSAFNLPNTAIKIMVGYNANLAHQQLLIINKISELDLELLNKIHLVFPLAYGGNSKELIEKALEKNKNIQYTILDSFYNSSEIAKLRSIIDILVNIQPTDQFSGSMQETLYAGGWVLTGSWLPYQELIKLKPKLEIIDSVEDVAIRLEKMIINQCRKSQNNTKMVMEFIEKSSSWKVNIPIWDAILFPKEIR